MSVLVPRSGGGAPGLTGGPGSDPVFKTVGLILALLSGLFIGSSFIFKKKGLLQANKGAIAGEGHSYLSNGLWWLGMSLMIIGEVCNFVAYAFTQAILVTPLGALSVVISAVLSSIFLHERLSMQGKIGCAQCIIGAIIILIHAPDQQTANTVEQFQRLFFHPVFLVYAVSAIFLSILVIWKIAPKYGSKNMLVYIGICSLIGSLSVVATQGLGSAIVTSIMGENQFTHWFLYVLMTFVAITLLVEINYLNKALNLFNTAMVTPVYYVTFTSLTMVSSAILFQGFTAPPVNIASVVLGFLVICSGIVLLQTSKGLDGRGSTIYPDDNRMSMASDTSLEPGASEIRASFGSIRRYSMHLGRAHTGGLPSNVSHRRTMSLNLGGYDNRRGSSASASLSPINESGHVTAVKTSTPNVSRGNIDTTAAQLSIAMGESPFEVELPSRVSTIRFVEPSHDGPNPTPFIHATAPSISSTRSVSPLGSPVQSPQLALPPPLSPLQHPINYIKSQLSHQPHEFRHTSNDPNFDHKGSTSSRRSQNSLSVVDKFKYGLHSGSGDVGEDFEGLVKPPSQGASSSSGKNPTKPTGTEENAYGSDDDINSSGSISPI